MFRRCAAGAMLGLAARRAARRVRRRRRRRSTRSSAWHRRARRRRSVGQYDPTFRKYTKRYFGPAFDWRYFKAQGFAESGLKAKATSWVGARGMMQLMPSTYQEIASHRPEFGPIDQPEWNIAAGIMHDRYLWGLWRKDIGDEERHHFMFASYNAGEGTIRRALARGKEQGWHAGVVQASS